MIFKYCTLKKQHLSKKDIKYRQVFSQNLQLLYGKAYVAQFKIQKLVHEITRY